MKTAIASLLLLSLFAASCTRGPKEIITGKWRGINFHNPEMDNFFAQSQKYIDTIGANGNPATNSELYGTTNMDSLRHALQLQYDSTQSIQQNAVKNTTFNFQKDGIVAISFDGRLDSSKWHFIGDKKLEMEEMTGSEKGTKTQMEVLTITETELKLKIAQDSSYSIVTFGRDK